MSRLEPKRLESLTRTIPLGTTGGARRHEEWDLAKEVAVLCEHGRRINSYAVFHEDDSCLGRSYNLLVASGSFQYKLDLLREFVVGPHPRTHGAPEQAEARAYLFRGAER